MKTNPNDTAQPSTACEYINQSDHQPTVGVFGGLTKREHFAAIALDDFSDLGISLQILIIGVEPPHFTKNNITSAIYNLEYAKWLAKGRAIWKVMQADALIEALNKEGQ